MINKDHVVLAPGGFCAGEKIREELGTSSQSYPGLSRIISQHLSWRLLKCVIIWVSGDHVGKSKVAKSHTHNC